MRTASTSRKTAETSIELELNIDGTGKVEISTGVGFFDHMIILMAKHALFDLSIKAQGDIEVDAHHTVEDIGICLGECLKKAVGDKKGIKRYGSMLLPMEEALCRVVLDISGRPLLEYRAEIPAEKCGEFDTCLGREFMRALCVNAGLNMHIDLLEGSDPHHCLEAIFKGCGRALKEALSNDDREHGIPSSKGTL